MSQELLSIASELLTTADESLQLVLKDYLREKAFLKAWTDIENSVLLREICEDLDAFNLENYQTRTNFRRFESVNASSDLSGEELNLTLKWDDYHCGSSDWQYEYLTIKKEWLVSQATKPWIQEWQSEHLASLEENFVAYLKKIGLSKEDGCKILAIDPKIDIPVIENFNKFMLELRSYKDIFPGLTHFMIDSNSYSLKGVKVAVVELNKEKITILEFLKQLRVKDFSQVTKAVDCFKAMTAKIEKEKEIIKKNEELALLSEKYSKVEIEEVEKFIKLKKELGV